ncbi:hypothetical protein ACFOLF_14095 [Paenibacillus sepulcri]|uniref:Uncharacterized protein n=1 Tax=Paenibacillus sepulcri TaxID=359917 RepID=A0ABS7C4H7_9BACL|nr:hypothetical protein [Paenibacillus sepulcri]
MNHVQATGTFIKVNEHIFRTAAELRFGNGSGKKIKLTMLNPGGSRLSDEEEWTNLLCQDGSPVTGTIALDQTMKAVCEIMYQALPGYEGVVRIENLFNLRCGNLDKALKLYSELKNKGSYIKVIETDLHSMSAGTYVCNWVGWSLKEHSLLNKRKREVFDLLSVEKSGIPRIGKHRNDNVDSIHMWHVRPQLKVQAEAYKTFIVPLLQRSLI